MTAQIFAVILVSSVVAYLSGLALRRWTARPRVQRLVLAALLPSLLILVPLIAWHFQASAEYARGPQTGFMSPLVILIYGFPYFCVNLAVNLLAARGALK